MPFLLVLATGFVVYFYNSSVYPSPFHSPVSIPCHILCVLVSVAIASFVELFIIIHDRHNIFVQEVKKIFATQEVIKAVLLNYQRDGRYGVV